MRSLIPYYYCSLNWIVYLVQILRKTRKSAKQVSQSSERGPGRAPRVPPVPQIVRNEEFEDRMEYFKWRDIVVERGIAVQELDNTHIP